MFVYVAASSKDLDRAESVGIQLEEAGCTVTQKWWEQIAIRAKTGLSDADVTEDQAASIRAGDEIAIYDSDYMLVLGDPPSGGLMYELGYARGLNENEEGPIILFVGKPHVIFGVPAQQEHVFDTEEDAIDFLAERADEL